MLFPTAWRPISPVPPGPLCSRGDPSGDLRRPSPGFPLQEHHGRRPSAPGKKAASFPVKRRTPLPVCNDLSALRPGDGDRPDGRRSAQAGRCHQRIGIKPNKNFGQESVASAVSLLYPLAIPYVVLGPLLSVKLPAWQIWVGSFIIWLGFYITARRNFWHSDRKFSDILSAKSKKPCAR